MTIKVLLAAVAALSVAGMGAADAASKHKRHKTMVHQPAGLYEPAAPNAAQTRGPIWANPNECYTDEGYGRYWPCGAGKGE
jgi:hypothetical protein